MGNGVSAPRFDAQTMSMKELKAVIAEAGLSLDGCIEKPDLQARAAEALAVLAARASATAATTTADVAASAVLTSDDAYLDVEDVVKKVRACDKDGNGKIDRQELQGLLASISVQGAAGATAAKEDFISQAAGGVVDVGKDKDGKVVKKVWMKDDNPIGYLWLLYGPLLLMAKLGKLKAVVEDNKVVRTAVQMVAACLGGFDTIVLATVFAGNWRSCWVSGLIATLLRNIPRCGMFTMFAVQGGPACDCEIQFIEIFMELLGAEVEKKAEDQGTYLVWAWKVKRDGADDCTVMLQQYKTVEDTSVGSLTNGFLPEKDDAHAPNLARCAVVSAPERDIAGEPIAARLNKNVGDALEMAKELAARKGFAPDMEDFANQDEWQKAFMAYVTP